MCWLNRRKLLFMPVNRTCRLHTLTSVLLRRRQRYCSQVAFKVAAHCFDRFQALRDCVMLDVPVECPTERHFFPMLAQRFRRVQPLCDGVANLKRFRPSLFDSDIRERADRDALRSTIFRALEDRELLLASRADPQLQSGFAHVLVGHALPRRSGRNRLQGCNSEVDTRGCHG